MFEDKKINVQYRTNFILASFKGSQGKIKDSGGSLERVIDEAIEIDRRDVILDMKGITFLTIPELNLLSDLSDKATKNNKRFFLLGAKECVLNMIQTNGLDDKIPNYKNLVDYYKGLRIEREGPNYMPWL